LVSPCPHWQTKGYLDQIGRDVILRQLINSALNATDRNEITGFTGINPERDFVR
jgi:hypothetical protein